MFICFYNTANIVTNATGGLLIDWEISSESTPFDRRCVPLFHFLGWIQHFFYRRQHNNYVSCYGFKQAKMAENLLDTR
jgi:hypothetical protein